MPEDQRFTLAGSFDCRDRRASLGRSPRPLETVADPDGSSSRFNQPYRDGKRGVSGRRRKPPSEHRSPLHRGARLAGGFRCRGSFLGASLDGAAPLGGGRRPKRSPASVVRESVRHQRSSIPWSRLGHNPGTTSRRSIHPRERPWLSSMRGVGSKAREVASTTFRLRTVRSQDQSPPASAPISARNWATAPSP
jgi:hypothetical protein